MIIFLFLVITSHAWLLQPKDLKFQADTCTPPPLGGRYNSCQLFNPWQNPDTGKAIMVSPDNKNDVPLGVRIGGGHTQVSTMRTTTHNNHPNGNTLLPGAGNLGGLLNTFLTSIDQDPQFLIYFGKIHLLVLHEIYQYLMSIYVTFNMTHVSTVQDHLLNQTTQALNKKTMIINHLFSVIEAQINKAILTRFPNIPEHIASRMGPLIMKNDYGADLNLMLEKQEEWLFAEPDVQNYFKQRRELYLSIFGNYLKFFKSYTAALEEQDPIYGSKFVQYAQGVQKVIAAESSHYSNVRNRLKNTTDMKAKVTALKEIKIINPPLFFYDEPTFRGMKIIPRLAKDLPKNSENVPWPKKLIEDATNQPPITNKWGNKISDQPPAYFQDAQGNNTTSQSDAVALYVNIPTIQNMYTQEVIPQPDWLNSYDGVMMMLRACLGDFTALYSTQLRSEFIIDPCLTCIILKSAQKAGIPMPGTDLEGACQTCQTYLQSLRNIIGWTKPTVEKPGQNGSNGGDENGNQSPLGPLSGG